ncbi:hypothetical protein FKM82_015201 [Ascaphus truei]
MCNNFEVRFKNHVQVLGLQFVYLLSAYIVSLGNFRCQKVLDCICMNQGAKFNRLMNPARQYTVYRSGDPHSVFYCLLLMIQ